MLRQPLVLRGLRRQHTTPGQRRDMIAGEKQRRATPGTHPVQAFSYRQKWALPVHVISGSRPVASGQHHSHRYQRKETRPMPHIEMNLAPTNGSLLTLERV